MFGDINSLKSGGNSVYHLSSNDNNNGYNSNSTTFYNDIFQEVTVSQTFSMEDTMWL
jgi:hypothetical protein